MSSDTPPQLSAARVFQFGVAAFFLSLSVASAQDTKENLAPIVPADLAAGGESKSVALDAKETKPVPKETVTDYTTQIGDGMKERERRLILLNEAMMKLREAGELEDAARVEERIRAMLEMPPPSQVNTKMRAEIEQLRAKNDDLTLQILSLQEEAKRAKTAPASNAKTPVSSVKKVAANTSGSR
ncbi:MAG TPA: hypothetical protein VG796_08705 [Verrucomicrobiales bacterium]|jgi:hypothetical protein|nr:hypothetical protein [Verrucomicrobiales bacterium]